MKNKKKKNEFDSDFETDDLGFKEEFDESDPISQTPLTKAERRMIKNTKQKSEDRSKLDHYDKSDIAEARRYAKNHKLKVLFVTVTIILLVAVLTALIVFAILHIKNGPSTKDYIISVGSEEPYELDYDEANEYGQFYFDLVSIAKYADLTVTGSDEKNGALKFSCEDETYVRFVDGQSVATVNGIPVEVGGEVHFVSATKDEKAKCLIPFTFIEKLFSYKADKEMPGMAVLISKKNEVTIHRYSKNNINRPISFSADCFIRASEGFYASLKTVSVDANTASALRTPMLVLVNKTYALEESEISSDALVSLSTLGCPVTNYIEEEGLDFFDPIAALALVAMINDANENLEGDDKILVSSAFRSFSYQNGLHKKYIEDYLDNPNISENEAKEQALLFSAPPGKSEHHTGLCVDLVDDAHKDKELSERFEETPAFEWLSKNAHKYGFILRYPKGKTDITKYSYEPWHYRFVGIYASSIIHEENITLEEFLAKTD